MLIRMFLLKGIYNERNILIHHEIIDCIVEQIVLTYGGQISHLLVYLNSLTFVLLIYGP